MPSAPAAWRARPLGCNAGRSPEALDCTAPRRSLGLLTALGPVFALPRMHTSPAATVLHARHAPRREPQAALPSTSRPSQTRRGSAARSAAVMAARTWAQTWLKPEVRTPPRSARVRCARRDAPRVLTRSCACRLILSLSPSAPPASCAWGSADGSSCLRRTCASPRASARWASWRTSASRRRGPSFASTACVGAARARRSAARHAAGAGR